MSLPFQCILRAPLKRPTSNYRFTMGASEVEQVNCWEDESPESAISSMDGTVTSHEVALHEQAYGDDRVPNRKMQISLVILSIIDSILNAKPRATARYSTDYSPLTM